MTLEKTTLIGERLESLLQEFRTLTTQLDAIVKANNGHAFDIAPEKRERAQIIVTVVCRHFDIAIPAIYSPARGNASVALARHVCMTLIRAKMGLNTYQVGDLMKRDHSTISHAEETIKDRIATDSKFAVQFARINQEVENAIKP